MDDAHDAEPEKSPYLRLPWPLVAAALAGVLLLALAVGLLANRYLRPQVGVVPTPIPIGTAVPSPTPPAALVATPALAPTPVPTAVPTPVALATSTQPPASALLAAVSPTPQPTMNPFLVEEVSQAYEHYWQIRAEALLNLDDSKLQEVMDGPHLRAIEDLIGELRSEQRAIATDIDHGYAVVEVSIDTAKVIDTYISNSVYVELETHAALTQPTNDRLRELYQLNRIGGTWKVVSLADAP